MTDDERLDRLRGEISRLDQELIELLGRRLDLVAEIGRLKSELGRPVLDPAREARVVRRAAQTARQRGVDPELVRDVLWRVIAHARDLQDELGPTEP